MDDLASASLDSATTRWAALARWAVAEDWQPSERALQRALDALIDTVGCMVAGQPSSAFTRVARTVAGWGEGPATLLGGGRVATPGAALANGTAAHALDFDDHDTPTIAHPSAVIVPAVLALGEAADADGRSALRAYIVGLEVMDRLGEIVNPWHYERGWHATSTLGSIAAAGAAACLLRLDPEQALAALSLGATMASGLKAEFGSEAKPFHVGMAAQNGVMAAELAASGLTAVPEALSGVLGFAGVYGKADGSSGAALPALPPPLAIEQHGLSVKKYPCCSYLGRILDLLLAERAAGRLAAEQVARIDIVMPGRSAAVVRFGIPRNADEARFSAPYCAAVALLEGGLAPRHFRPEAIELPVTLALARRIAVTASPKPQALADMAPEDPDELHVELTDGRRIELLARVVRGGPDQPLSRQELLAKLTLCAEGILEPAQLAALAAQLEGFAERGRVRDLMALLGRPT